MKISVNIEKDSLCSRFFIMIRVEIRLDSKNYSAVVKSKIVLSCGRGLSPLDSMVK